jgi:hypothetical protein
LHVAKNIVSKILAGSGPVLKTPAPVQFMFKTHLVRGMVISFDACDAGILASQPLACVALLLTVIFSLNARALTIQYPALSVKTIDVKDGKLKE